MTCHNNVLVISISLMHSLQLIGFQQITVANTFVLEGCYLVFNFQLKSYIFTPQYTNNYIHCSVLIYLKRRL